MNSEAEHKAYRRYPAGCTCNDGKHTTEPCPFCQELANQQMFMDEQVQDQ